MCNGALHKSVPDKAITLSKITDTSTSYKNEFNYILKLNEQVSLPNKMDSYIVKYDLDGNDNLVLNPYLSLINGTDLLITKDIPDALVVKYEVKFDWSNPDKAKILVTLETSSDGVNYNACKVLPANQWIVDDEYKNILLWMFLIEFTELPAGTYIRLKVENLGDDELKIVPPNCVNPERRHSAELRIRLDV